MSKKPRMFITGATGFVGANLVRHFATGGWELSAQGRGSAPQPLMDLAQYMKADIQKPLPPQAATVVIHAAALASDTASREALYQANVIGTRHVLEACRNCACFIYISSSSVYETADHVHVETENVDHQNLSPYGLSKRNAEDWLLEQDWSARSLYILRPRAVYGPGDRILLPRLLRLVRAGRIFAPGEMRVSSSLTHVDNLCRAVETCVTHWQSGTAGQAQTFNVADAEPYEMRNVVQQLLSTIQGKELPFNALPLRPMETLAHVLERFKLARQFSPYALAAVSKNSTLDLQKSAQTLGFIPQRNLWESLPELAAWVQRVGVQRVKQADPGLPWDI